MPGPLRDYAVDQWTSRDGLPHNSIRDLAQTPDGYLWFATWEGLVRYDGLEFVVYDRSTSTPALLDNGVGTLYVDPTGALWFSDSRGNVGRRDAGGAWRVWSAAEEGWPQVLVHAMVMDAQGRLWLLFEGRGLGALHADGRFEYTEPPPGVPLALSYPHMAVGQDGRIWIGGLGGLLVREPDGRLHRAPAALGLAPGLAWPYRAPDGAIWLVAGDSVHRIEGAAAPRRYRIPGQGDFTAMLQDRHGALWLGSESRGLLRIGARGVETPPTDAARPPGRIVGLLEDAEGSVWAGANGGLFRLRETLFQRLTAHDGLSGDYARALLEDRDGTLWIGGASGLDRHLPDGHLAPFALQPGVPPSVLSLAQDRDGDVWVGAYGGRVFRMRDGVVVDRLQGFPGHIRAIEATPDGAVWIATHSGPVRLVDGRVDTPRVPGLPTGLVTSLAWIDDALWVGSVEGASVLEGGRVRHVALPAGARTVFAFRRIGDAVWMATDRGLHRVRGNAVAPVGLAQGLPVDTVFQIVPDRIGNAWITSNRGMLRARMQDLDAVADGRLATLPLERYDEIDGMSSAQGNGSSSPSAILRADGSVWMATARGISGVDPQRWSSYRKRLPPVPRIDAVRLDGEPLDWRDGQQLEGGARISVSFVGLSFLMSDRIRFRTRLEGLDARWIEHGRQRSVEFVGLPPGDYVLQVEAAHPEGEWSAHPAAWHFSVAPRWWQRHSVQLALAVLALLAPALLYGVRLRRYRRANDRLSHLVDERTRTLQRQTEQLLEADREKTELLGRLQAQAETFERQALEDALTGLPNRRSFDAALAREFARAHRKGQPLCLMILDVDRFKTVNDQYSHVVGDAVLRQVGELLMGACRATDIAARIGGEEFALILVDTSPDEAHVVYARLRDAFARRTDWGGVPGLRITISAGSTRIDPLDTAPAQLVRRADMALYRAKSAGRDQLCDG
ncbi:ligand-binding sensor domain-containing diguanylate cyclase [Luteimonas deserti]|uniref:diguanylate cyclase n=1 Tax=Luteimonas deserti TaxID=2752306 RepID=A0A7Z0U125_9GAMM|nr:ligand-binding sensor domain-containing diguanylate cyclase [Luteimonas deserti]NYZ63893.1 diguanylate cyclase [Luteimonas deserti]